MDAVFVEALKNVAEVVALGVISYLALRVIANLILALLRGNNNSYKEVFEENERGRKISEQLSVAITKLTLFLQQSDNAQQARADRNMLMSMDRFDDIEYILMGIVPTESHDRFMVISERRRQRDSKYARFLADNNIPAMPEQDEPDPPKVQEGSGGS
jgi:hypothetical protein